MTSPPAGGDYRRSVYPVTIDGPRVRLRDFQDGDLDASMSIVGDPQVTWYLSFETRTREQQGHPAGRRHRPRPQRPASRLLPRRHRKDHRHHDRRRPARVQPPPHRRARLRHPPRPVGTRHRVQAVCGPDNPPPSGSWPSSASSTRAGCATTFHQRHLARLAALLPPGRRVDPQQDHPARRCGSPYLLTPDSATRLTHAPLHDHGESCTR